MELRKLKINYNHYLGRYNKAEKFFESDNFFNSSNQQQEKWLQEFHSVCRNLSQLQQDIEKILGRKLTEKENFEGFKEVRNDN